MGVHQGLCDRALAMIAVAIRALRRLLTVPVGYLTVLTGAAWVATLAGRTGTRPSPQARRFAVLVPAHDEEQVIGETLDGAGRARLPGGPLPRSTSSPTTAPIATVGSGAAAGVDRARARRTEVRGKGPALASTIDELLGARSRATRADAIVIVDADTIVAPGVPRARSTPR